MVDISLGAFAGFLAPERCHFCGSLGTPACAGCVAALPWNGCACPACGLPMTSGTGACGECLRQAPPQDCSWAAFRYATPVAEAIVQLKFRGRLAGAHMLGRLMAHRLARRPEPLPEVLVPVPLAPGRLRRRGYNQALEIGRALGRCLALELAPGAAHRMRHTQEQTRLDAAGRQRNVRGAFRVDPRWVRGRHVALLDDVITTGATMAELARATRAAGAVRIEAWAAARVA